MKTWLAAAPISHLEAVWLLESVVGEARLSDTTVLSDTERALCDALLARRLAGEPLGYLTHQAGFWRFADWQVTPDTLIPRPETEHLVEWILATLPASAVTVLELGVGSGALIATLLTERPLWHGVGVDISDAALVVAQQNAMRRGVVSRLQLLRSNWYHALPDDHLFDVIVSNPPYLAADDPYLPQLTYEPQQALVAGETGLEALAMVVTGAVRYLKPSGWLVVEHGYAQGAAVAQLFQQAGFQLVQTHCDLAGLTRFCVGRL